MICWTLDLCVPATEFGSRSADAFAGNGDWVRETLHGIVAKVLRIVDG